MPTIDDLFPYETMMGDRTLFHHRTFQDALNQAKSWVKKDWDSIVILKKEKSGETRVIGTVRMQNGKPYWLAKRFDAFNGRVAVPIKKGKKKKSEPAPFGL